MDRTLIKSYTAAAQVTVRRAVKFDATSPFANVQPAAAATDSLVGIATMAGDGGGTTIAAGNRVDVILDGVAQAEAGAAFSAGALLSCDASGRVIAATASAGSNVRVIGMALQPASAAGDIVDVYVQQASFQG